MAFDYHIEDLYDSVRENTEEYYDEVLGTAAVIGGGGLLAKSLQSAAKQAGPGGMKRMLADYSSNFLEGFYKPDETIIGRTFGPKAHQLVQYSKELGRAGQRMAKTGASPLESFIYKDTGVSGYLRNKISEGNIEIQKIQNNLATDIQTTNRFLKEGKWSRKYADEYINGRFRIDKDEKGQPKITGKGRKKHHTRIITKKGRVQEAQDAIKHIRRENAFKITSDYSNTMLFGGKPSGALKEFGSKYVTKATGPQFKKDIMGNKKIADYVIGIQRNATGRQDLHYGNKNLTFLHYKRGLMGDTLRAAQYHTPNYKAMLYLKNNAPVRVTANGLEILASNLSKIKGISQVKVLGGKTPYIVWTGSPNIKPNWDWGGFNASGVWNPSKPGKVRFVVTDIADAPINRAPGLGIPKAGFKYTTTREVNITDNSKLKKGEAYAEQETTVKRKPIKQRGTRPLRLDDATDFPLGRGSSQSISPEGHIVTRKIYNPDTGDVKYHSKSLGDDLDKVQKTYDKKHRWYQKRYRKIGKFDEFFKGFMKRRIGGAAGGALAIAGLAWTLLDND